MNFLIINGPNLNLLGKREPGIYGSGTYSDLCRLIQDYASAHGCAVQCFQSNHEGAIVDKIHEADGRFDAIIINPAAYTHYSYAILDALKAVSVPAYEVHISHIDRREPFRAVSVTAPACVGQIYGLGFEGYLRAMDYFLERAGGTSAPVKLCVIGDPVAHSLSPTIHTAMLSALGRAGSYTAETVPISHLPDFVRRVRAGDFSGFNATMPHKVALMELVDRLDDSARLCGAVNTVRVEDGQLVGCSTDGNGLVAALESKGAVIADAHVVMLGAGGAARSVAAALVRAGARQVAVCNRTSEKAEQLCAMAPDILIPESFDIAALRRRCARASVLINATNLGMEGCGQFEDLSFLNVLDDSSLVCDLIYHPAETALLRRARERGLTAVNGLPMLVWQGVLALEQFLNTSLDRPAMAEIALRSLAD